MTWFNVLYYLVMTLAFLGCLGMAARSRHRPMVALVWLVAAPIVAFAAPAGILFAAITVALWLILDGLRRVGKAHPGAGRAARHTVVRPV
ncbi:hypothetical protein [Peterkaempfera bronchialis]|uniref:Uncharacterized protein n=1 Tax=Peterkaempfera bronchialis TaxID=2126346 RepID=A0A345SZG4_9ACTN|nr:hypothetical protein [Peterkaempfera bronchialis]AXI79119.1 hypothetical protein C7M71_018550 [Peterkaempfera bronchialis]